ncbi:MAG: hypothetical protein QW543_02130 [Sulfolobales archaeon]
MKVLCRDGEFLLGCEVEVGKRYVNISIKRTRRTYRVDLTSVVDLTYEELSGKLLITLANGRVIEMQPQVTEDRDVVSKVLVYLTLLKNPSSMDLIGQVLKAFSTSVHAVLRLTSALREADYGIDWRKIMELAETVAGTIRLSEDLLANLNEEDLYRLLDSVSHRDIKGVLGSAKNLIVSLSHSAKQALSKVLPGTSPEALLDVTLAAVLSSALGTLGVSLGEKELSTLEEVISSSIARFGNVMSVDESLLKELNAGFRRTQDVWRLVDDIINALRKSYRDAIGGLREAPRQGK